MRVHLPRPLLQVGVAAMVVMTPRRLHAQDTVTAFVNVTVIPMDREQVLKNQTVVVRGDRIVALGPTNAVRVPVEARRIDGRRKFLMPGLADMHAHVNDSTAAELYLYVANGVTTIRSMGGNRPGIADSLLAFRARAAQGVLLSPRLYVATGPAVPNLEMEEIAAYVARAKAAGFDLIKLYGVDGAVLDSLAATARRAGLPIAGHAPSWYTSPLALPRAIATGYASIEHLHGFELYLGGAHSNWYQYWIDTISSPRQMLADTVKLRTMAAELQRAGVWNCPTLAVYEGLAAATATWPEMRYVAAEDRRGLPERVAYAVQPAYARTVQAVFDVQRAIVKALRDAGAGLLLGTDAGVDYLLPGFGVHRELEALVRAGLRPYEALATGTRNVAVYFGTLDSTGTVAVGKRADLVLLAGNPLQDIRRTMHPAGVMLGGRWLARAELDRGLAAFDGHLRVGH